jgi:hypothetical protein
MSEIEEVVQVRRYPRLSTTPGAYKSDEKELLWSGLDVGAREDASRAK